MAICHVGDPGDDLIANVSRKCLRHEKARHVRTFHEARRCVKGFESLSRHQLLAQYRWPLSSSVQPTDEGVVPLIGMLVGRGTGHSRSAVCMNRAAFPLVCGVEGSGTARSGKASSTGRVFRYLTLSLTADSFPRLLSISYSTA